MHSMLQNKAKLFPSYSLFSFYTTILEAYFEPFQTSKMEPSAEIVNGSQPLTIFTKRSILNVFKDTHREGVPQNETQTLKKIMNMGIWVVGT